MLMTDTEILNVIKTQNVVIKPFDQTRLQGASYDLSVGKEALVSKNDNKVILSESQSLHLNAGDFALIMSGEYVKMPLDIACSIGMKSTLARKGLILLAGMQIDPGFEGYLRFGLYNASPRKLTLDYQDPMCTIEFHKLAMPVKKIISPNNDLINGKIPESDREYLRSLETTSLSDIDNNMRTLIQSVNSLTNVVYKFLVPIMVAVFAGVVIAVLKGITK
jgi:deoxycytidine triphosphate deaminase